MGIPPAVHSSIHKFAYPTLQDDRQIPESPEPGDYNQTVRQPGYS